MNWQAMLIWGLLATVVLTTVQAVGRDLGFTRMDIPYLLGTIFTSDRDRAKWLGFLVHLLNGWVFALIYILIIQTSGLKTWWFGMLLGLIHATFVLVFVTDTLPAIHPRMASEEHGPDPTRQLEPPGAFALNYGKRTPLVAYAAHLIYGSILGLFYH